MRTDMHSAMPAWHSNSGCTFVAVAGFKPSCRALVKLSVLIGERGIVDSRRMMRDMDVYREAPFGGMY